MTRQNRRKQPPQHQRSSVEVDVAALLQIENACGGCAVGQKCCCSSYEVCVTTAEMKRIIRFLPEASKYCPHLQVDGGYDNVFEQEEPGLYSIETGEDGLCLLAYWKDGRTHCSLHTLAMTLGLPLEEVKPKVCMLWPLHFSDGDEVLGVISDAFLFSCNSRRTPGSRLLSPGVLETLDRVYGEGFGEEVRQAAASGERRRIIATRR